MSVSLDGVLIKKANQKQHYARQEMMEFARCADPINGPHYFMDNYFPIQHPTKGKIQYKPFDFQKRLIDTYHANRFSISMLPRQCGKTTTAAGYLLWYAMFKPDSLIIVAAHKFSGALEIMQRIRYAYELCPDHIRAGASSYAKGSIEFDNGSRIMSEATTETTARGKAVTLIYLDEFAYVRPSVASEFWTSISPTLSTGGSCIITSTPNSDEDQFAMIWRDANKTINEYGDPNMKEDNFGNDTLLGKNDFKPCTAAWNEHPDRDEKWAKEEQGRIGEERFRREFGCEFIINDETLIDSLKLTNLYGLDPLFKHGQVRWYKTPDKTMTHTIALDPSLGTGGDPAAIQIFEMPSMEQVGEWQHNKTPIQKQVKILAEITKYLVEDIGVENEDIYYSVENNSVGEAALVAISEIGEENIHGIFLSEPKKKGQVKAHRKGFTTTNKNKLATCAKMKQLIETDRLTIKSKNLVSEFKTFVALGNSFEAKIGETDDLVMSTLLIVRMANVLKEYKPDVNRAYTDRTDDYEAPMPFILV